jgi:hypothetical protein
MAKIKVTPFSRSLLTHLFTTEEALCASYLARSLHHPRLAADYTATAERFLTDISVAGWIDMSQLVRGFACNGSDHARYHFALSAKGRRGVQLFKLNAPAWYHPYSGTPCKIKPEELIPHQTWRVC